MPLCRQLKTWGGRFINLTQWYTTCLFSTIAVISIFEHYSSVSDHCASGKLDTLIPHVSEILYMCMYFPWISGVKFGETTYPKIHMQCLFNFWISPLVKTILKASLTLLWLNKCTVLCSRISDLKSSAFQRTNYIHKDKLGFFSFLKCGIP